MASEKRPRLQFSIKSLLVAVTLLAAILGGWISYASYRVRNLTALRKQDAIVIVRDQTPNTLKSIGITKAGPLFSTATVELYITPMGANALIGTTEEPVPTATAEKYILEKATEARTNGAKDIQLIVIGNPPFEWMNFAREHSLTVVTETKERYAARLKANQESGANINPPDAREVWRPSQPRQPSSVLRPTPRN